MTQSTSLWIKELRKPQSATETFPAAHEQYNQLTTRGLLLTSIFPSIANLKGLLRKGLLNWYTSRTTPHIIY
jgi:hypothetical protein